MKPSLKVWILEPPLAPLAPTLLLSFHLWLKPTAWKGLKQLYSLCMIFNTETHASVCFSFLLNFFALMTYLGCSKNLSLEGFACSLVCRSRKRRRSRGERGRVIFPLYLNFRQPSLLLLWYSCFYHPPVNQREFVWAVKEWHEVSYGASQAILSSACLGLHHVQLPACPHMHDRLKEQHVCRSCDAVHLNLWMLSHTSSCTCPLAPQVRRLFQPVHRCEWRSKDHGDQGYSNSSNMLKATRFWQQQYQVSKCYSGCNLRRPQWMLNVAENITTSI